MNVACFHGKMNIAKPVLMLSIMHCIEDGKIMGNRIVLTRQLIDTYNTTFQSFHADSITSPVYPYYYLNHED